MKKKKTVISILLAIILATALFAVPAGANGIHIQSIPSDLAGLAKLDAWSLSHPKEIIEIGQQTAAGNYDAIGEYMTDSDNYELYMKGLNYSLTVGTVIKAASISINPRNSERNLAPSISVSGPSTYNRNSQSTKPSYSFLSIRNDKKGKVNINLFLIYEDRQNNLVALGLLRNESGQKIQIDGISSIQLTTNGKELAGGTPSKFEVPVQLAPHEAKVNTGVTDGLPTMCFIKMTFAPGTYDDSIDISNLDNVGCIFSLDYSVIQ